LPGFNVKRLRYALISTLVALAGCGTDMPIKRTSKSAHEYVLNRDDKTPLGNLRDLKERVQREAESLCKSHGLAFSERYSIDKERAILVWPETTLYFECVDPTK
jgi:hypothetical protein